MGLSNDVDGTFHWTWVPQIIPLQQPLRVGERLVGPSPSFSKTDSVHIFTSVLASKESGTCY